MNKNDPKPLQGKVAVVAGATRGAGRAIAVMLGAAGATVYCTGRSVRGQVSDIKRSETIDDTADMVTARGGIGIAVQCDHTVEEQVKALFERIREERKDGWTSSLMIYGEARTSRTGISRSGSSFCPMDC